MLKMESSEKKRVNGGTAALLLLGSGFLILAIGGGAYVHLEVIVHTSSIYYTMWCRNILIFFVIAFYNIFGLTILRL